MTLTKKYEAPFQGLWSNFLDNTFSGIPAFEHAANSLPLVNIFEDNDEFTIEMAVPGVNKNDIHIDIEEQTLKISMNNKKEGNNKEFSRREFNYTSFRRLFNLPDSVKTENINASYLDGVLNIVVPKKEEAKPLPTRSIKVS